jgi:hypothetical protein
MSIASRRRAAPAPATASSTVVTAVHTHLQDAPQGLYFAAIVDKSRFDRTAVAEALSAAVDAGLVRFVPALTGPRFLAAEHLPLPEVSSATVDAVMTFIACHEDFERGSPDVVLAVDNVVQGLGKKFSTAQVVAAFDTLRREAMLWFRLQPASGIATVTLSRHRHFTILGHDGGAHQPLCFHVRAGNREVAYRKLQESPYAGPELALHGIVEGQLHFEALPGHGGMLVEQF